MPAAAKAKRRRRVKHYIIGNPHAKYRQSCRWCKKPKHNHTPSGNTHRFHGPGSFCATHATTVRGRKYCKTTKTKPRRSDWVQDRVTGSWYYEGGLPKSRRYQPSSKR